MIFDLTKSYVPESYVDSRDYRVFLRQLGMLATVFKFNIDQYPSLYSADNCPEHMLPLLATMVGYTYKDTRSVSANRKIIKEFPYLIRNRGSAKGIKAAVVLSINTTPGITHYYSEESIILDINVEDGLINIYYPRVDVIDWDLIEVVRPVGMTINLFPSDMSTVFETLQIRDKVKVVNRNKIYDDASMDSTVGYSVNTDVIERESDTSE